MLYTNSLAIGEGDREHMPIRRRDLREFVCSLSVDHACRLPECQNGAQRGGKDHDYRYLLDLPGGGDSAPGAVW
jgi:hypothetical protein